jgi:hypothetical protein
VEAIKTITAQGRALAVSVVIATQYPTNDALGDKLIAANMTAAVCLRVNKPAETNVALGPGAVSAGWLAHKISASKPGSLYLRAAGAEEPRLARSDQVTEPMVERAAAALGTHRPRLDEGSEHAALGTPQSTGARHAARTDTGPGLSTVPTAPDGTVGGTPMRTVATPPEGTGPGVWGGGQRRSAAAEQRDPLAALLAALAAVGEWGARAEDLAVQVGMSRAWVFTRLGELERGGQVVRSRTGTWKLVQGEGGSCQRAE